MIEKYKPGKIPQTRYECKSVTCGHEWKPRNPRPGDSVFCPKCGTFHSKRWPMKKPPRPQVYIRPGEPVKREKSRPIKPHEKKEYRQGGGLFWYIS